MFEQITFYPAQMPPAPWPGEPQSQETKSRRLRPRVLVVDDERLIATTVTAILNANGFEAIAVFSGEEAIQVARDLRPDIVLSDVLMPRMSGVDLGMQLKQEFPEIRIFLFSGQAATTELMRKAQAAGHQFELFPKPIHPEELLLRLRGA